MVQLSTFLSIASSAALVAAAPTVSSLEARAACTFSGATGAADALKNKASCSSITLNNLVVPAGTTLNLENLKAGTSVIFSGTTTFGYKEWAGPLISISGTNIHISGAAGNLIDANGARWWDTKGSNGGKTKPKFFAAHKLITSTINGLNFKDSPIQLMSINQCQGLTVNKVTMDNVAGDTKGGHNTDAFDVGDSSDIYISGAVVKNQDDCLAVNSARNITFIGGSCSGGHGLSIGSVGNRSNNVVKTVRILSSTIKDSDNGVRIKTIEGATGSVSDVVYKDITLVNIAKYGIVIQQDYNNGSPSGNPTTGVPITDLTLDNVHGTVAAKGTNIYLLCGSGSCSKWTWNKVAVTGGKKSTACKNFPSPAFC